MTSTTSDERDPRDSEEREPQQVEDLDVAGEQAGNVVGGKLTDGQGITDGSSNITIDGYE